MLHLLCNSNLWIMAVARNNNVVTYNHTGRLGDIILRMVDGRSVMSFYPKHRGSKRHWSRAQKMNHRLFKAGAAYGKRAVAIPEVRKYYESKLKWGQHAENVAISDFMLHPEIREIDLSDYEGREGNEIKVTVCHKYKVASVLVTILSALGLVVESGMAVEDPEGSGEWIYRTLEKNPGLRGGRVVVKVTNLPGKEVTGFRVLDG